MNEEKNNLRNISLQTYFLFERKKIKENEKTILGESTDGWIPVDVSFIKEFWLPDAEILNLKEFKTLDVLSKVDQTFFDICLFTQYKCKQYKV